MERENRRDFLKRCAPFCAAAVAAANMVSARAEQKEQWLSLGKPSDFPDGAATRVEKAFRTPKRKEVKNPKLIVFRKGNSFQVMSTRCTHFGCEVNLLADNTFACPCHKAQYDKTGLVTKGPAKKPLSWYHVNVSEDGEILVNLGKTIDPPKAE